MARTVINAKAHAAGLLAALRAASSDVPVGDHEAPASSGETYTPPYAVLYLLDAETDGTLDDPDVDATWPFQITSVGTTPEQAQSIADELRGVVLNDTIAITDRAVVDRAVEGLGRVTRQDTREGPRFSTFDRYTITTTPS